MAERRVRGVVRARRPLAAIPVSNGEAIVHTATNGTFELPLDYARHSTVFVMVPDGYDAVGQFYHHAKDIGPDGTLEFRLRKRAKRRRGMFLHIADTHVNALSEGPTSPEQLAAALRDLNAAEPEADMIVATGDLTNRGDEASLRAWRRVSSQAHRHVVSVFGGHDGNWERRQPDAEGSLSWTRNWERHVAPAWYAFDWCGYHFIVHCGEDHFLGKMRRRMRDRWLRSDLSRVEGKVPIIILMHSPPSASFVRRIAKCGVVAVFYGHWHSSKAYRLAGVKLFSTPCLPYGAIDTRPRGYRRVRIGPDGVAASLKSLVALPEPDAPPENMRPIWQAQIPGGAHRAGIVAAQDLLLVSVCDENLDDLPGVLALDPSNGRPVWRVAADSSVKNSVAVGEGVCAAVSNRGEVILAEPTSGRCLWRRKLAGHPDRRIFTSPLVSGGLVVAGTAFGLEARRARSGALMWRWRHEKVTSDAWSHYASAFVFGDLIVVPCMRQGLTALRLADGQPVWEAEGHTEYSLAQPVAHGGRIFAAFHPATLVTIDAARGVVLRRKRLGNGLLSALAARGNTVYSVTTDGLLRAHRASDGRLRWTAELGPELLDITPYTVGARSAWARPLVTEDRVVLACADGHLRVYDSRSGACLRDVVFKDMLTATPCLHKDRLYVAAYGGTLWALPWNQVRER